MEDKQLMPDQGTQPLGCPVYDWADRDDVDAPVHLVADEDMASKRVAANCGAMPGNLGWAIWVRRRARASPVRGLSRPDRAEALRESH